jgi:hypothetical protein
MSYYKSFIEDSIKKSQTSYKNLGLTKSYERDFYPGYLEIAKGKVLPFFYDAKRKSNVTTVALQTTSKANSFAYSDIFQIQFEAFGARGSSDHRWLLRVYLRAGKDACDLRAESETRISIGSGIPTYLSYTFLIPRERGKCFDITNKNQFISTAKSEWFSVAPGDKAMFDQMKCDYPSYRPMMMTEFWAEADPTLVGGWEVIIDPRCQKATSFGPFVRTYHYNYRTQMSDTEPGLGMWIGTFRTEG